MKSGKRMLILVLLLWWIAIARPAGMMLLGASSAVMLAGTICLLLAVPVMGLAILKYRRVLPQVAQPGLLGAQRTLLLLLTAGLCIYGLIVAASLKYVVLDTMPFLFMVAFLWLGRYDQVWQDLEKPLLVMFWLSVPLVLLGTQMTRPPSIDAIGMVATVKESELRSERGSVLTMAYRIQHFLTLWPLLFSLAYLRPRMDKWKLMGLGTALFVLALEVWFQKRAPVMRTLMYIAMIVLVIPFFQRRLKMGTALMVLLALAVFGVLATSTSSYLGLVERYQREAGSSFWENERYQEAGALLGDLGGIDWLFGRGMGGTYRPPAGWRAGTDIIDGEYVNRATHVGFLVPMLKGGLLLVLVYYAPFMAMVFPKPRGWYQNRYNTAAMAVLPVYFLFQFIEGAPSMATPFAVALVGLSCARVASPSIPDQETLMRGAAAAYASEYYPSVYSDYATH